MAVAIARILTARCRGWIGEFREARVLHVFDRSANLVDDQGRVLSIVGPEIGPGPFNLVLRDSFAFKRRISPASVIAVGSGTLKVGELTIRLAEAETWNPVPPWRSVRANFLPGLIETIREEMAASPIKPAIEFDPPPDPADQVALAAYAARLAGLGPGLTPSGDDVLVGLMHACFIRFPEGEAEFPAGLLASTAAVRTTTLSSAWLTAAAAGEAGADWHGMIAAAAGGDRAGLRDTIRRILATGHTSGADALAGFSSGLTAKR